MRALLAGAVLLLVVAGCSDDGDADAGDNLTPEDVEELTDAIDDAPDCDELFADGAEVDAILEHLDTNGLCIDDEGEPVGQGIAFFDCDRSDAEVHYNDYGWGIDGQTWHAEADPEVPADIC